MNPEIKEKWITALRSGKYKQGTYYLRSHDGHEYRYCCLGVLTDLYHCETGLGTWLDVPIPDIVVDCKSRFRIGTQQYVEEILPENVVSWAGLSGTFADHGEYPTGSLIQDNDGNIDNGVTPKTFAEIADIIEEHF